MLWLALHRISTHDRQLRRGPLAQLVEQLTLNQRVVGSIPTRLTNLREGKLSEYCRAVGKRKPDVFFDLDSTTRQTELSKREVGFVELKARPHFFSLSS